MDEQLSITNYCSVKANCIRVNGEIAYQLTGVEYDHFIKSAFKSLEISYGKFYKMDNLCKLAFVASEFLFHKWNNRLNYTEKEVAAVFANSTSSLDTDMAHQESIKNENNYFPSPAVFVYTLPNILIGEICIRNKFKGENAFFIFDKPNAGFMAQYIRQILVNEAAKCCVTGWVDLIGKEYEAYMAIIEKTPKEVGIELNQENLSTRLK